MPTTTSRARVMQRVRIGLTGLACVFLLVLIGTASISNEAPAAKPDKPEETLAQLGIAPGSGERSEEHTSELQSLMRISYAVFCLIKKKRINSRHHVIRT